LTLDSWMIARLAAELHARAAGARIQSARGGPNALTLQCYRRGSQFALRAALAAGDPIAAIVDQPENENGAGGWAAGVAPLLRGSIIESVQAVPSDRIIYIDVGSRSAFGVPSRHRIVLELEPNKVNALVLRPDNGDGWRILAAAKQIRGRAGARSVLAGETYVGPPPRIATLDSDGFARAIAALLPADDRAVVRLLGQFDIDCTPVLAREVVGRSLDIAESSDSDTHAVRLLRHWKLLKDELVSRARDPASPVYAWRSGDRIAACHLVRLTWPPGVPVLYAELNALCVERLEGARSSKGEPLAIALREKLATLLARNASEIARLERDLTRAADADADRRAGDAVYAHLHEIPKRASRFVTPEGVAVALDPEITPAANAAAYFKRYKKARSGLPKIEQRLATLGESRALWEQFLWDLERASATDAREFASTCEEIADAIGHLVKRAAQPKRRAPAKPASVEIAGGAIAFVGRSPKDNERVTFSVGGPDDFWFHARGIPGAHVVLKLGDAREAPTEVQLAQAASLAAGHCAAADAAKVEVDYTRRKFVRKQGKGRVGQVYYTNASTLLVAPRRPESDSSTNIASPKE
jgi:predicted ribosome quality control (RQC) complex YloA/Tae2 family protein